MTVQGEKRKASTDPFFVIGALLLAFGAVMTLVDAAQATSVGPGGPIALIAGAVLVTIGYVRRSRRP
jgi:hypothetical protein